MVDWQKGIAQLDPNATVNFSFRNGFSTYCDNPQLFKALGIYDEVERDILRGYESAPVQYWGVPIASEDHGYYNRTERPVVTVISNVETDESDMGKTVVLKNGGKDPQYRTEKVSTSETDFEETVIDISTSMEFNQSTNIGVESESSKFSITFSAKSDRQVTKTYAQESETKFTIATGEQLVRVTNPTQMTKFKVTVVGKFCLNCAPQFNGHYLWMPQLNETYECEVVAKDVGATMWSVEPITAQPVGTLVKHLGAF